MKKFFLIIICLCQVQVLTGCSTTETHPARAPIWAIILPNNSVEAHINRLRDELKVLNEEALMLELRCRNKAHQLDKVIREWRTKTYNSSKVKAEQRETNRQLGQYRQRLTSINHEIANLKSKLSEQENALSNSIKKKDDLENANSMYESKIKKLETEVIFLETSIEQLLIARAKHGLEI